MTDDWSLKGKEKTTEKDIFQSMENLNKRFIYSKEDIETLRKKLIEDIKEEAMKAGNEICWEDCKTLINKRFGVDE